MAELNTDTNQTSTFVDIHRLSMFTPAANGRRSKLLWSVRDDCPRITVFPNLTQESSPPIFAGMDPSTFNILLLTMEKVAKGSPGEKLKVLCHRLDQDTKKMVVMSAVNVGKDENGMVWISVTAADKPEIRFYFKISEWHDIWINDKQITEAEGSVIATMAAINALRTITANITSMYYYNYKQANPQGRRITNRYTSDTPTPQSAFDEDIVF